MSDFSRNVRTITTATGAQRRWRGRVADETIRKWLRQVGRSQADVSVYTIEKARAIPLSERTVET